MTNDPVQPAHPVMVKQRYINHETREWALECDRILSDHGVVVSQNTYQRRHEARYRARKLIRVLTELKLRERWTLVEHVEKRGSEYGWAVEHIRSDNSEQITRGNND